MRCVNDTLPPRPRRRWLLMTTRLSMSSLAGMTRTLVAVGTARLASMLATTRAAAPFRGLLASVAGVVTGLAVAASAFGSSFFASAFASAFLGASVVFAASGAAVTAAPFVAPLVPGASAGV